MRPLDLYQRKPERETKELWSLQDGGNGKILPDIQYFVGAPKKPNERVTLRFLKDWCFDGRRTWQLFTVWLDERPVMIVQRAGREGDDHIARFVTDAGTYGEMIKYLREITAEEEEISEHVAPDAEVEGLDRFYGYSLDGSFDRW